VFDYTLAIGKTPIVVNDSRGFYTSRVIGTSSTRHWPCSVKVSSRRRSSTRVRRLLPAPPLQLSDELNLELMHKIALATRKGVEDGGGTYERTRPRPPGEKIEIAAHQGFPVPAL
jgi:3-hydroxyacyl-CoA dehydrogenase/enoyl-CoA hydratase/3-hydroxybutyryl-CoA epimerase